MKPSSRKQAQGKLPRGRGIREYLRAKRQEQCVVCQTVPEKLRKEIRDVVQRQLAGATATVALEWLASEYGIKITLEQWRTHSHAQHKP